MRNDLKKHILSFIIFAIFAILATGSLDSVLIDNNTDTDTKKVQSITYKSQEPIPTPIIFYEHGTKLSVQYYPDKNETKVYHYIPANDAYHKEPAIRPDLTVGERTIKNKHTFELFDLVSYEGRKPSKIPTNTCLTITHAISSRDEWHFPQNTKLFIIVDGSIINIPVFSQIELKKDDPSDEEYYECIIAEPSYEMYRKIANGKHVIIQIGPASFKLYKEIIASYGNFLRYITPSDSK